SACAGTLGDARRAHRREAAQRPGRVGRPHVPRRVHALREQGPRLAGRRRSALVIPEPKLGAKSVLVVDDDEHTRNLLKDLCETAGYTVRLAQDGIEGLDLIAQAAPDLVLLDLMMPRNDGFQVLKALRDHAQFKDPAVIIL